MILMTSVSRTAAVRESPQDPEEALQAGGSAHRPQRVGAPDVRLLPGRRRLRGGGRGLRRLGAHLLRLERSPRDVAFRAVGSLGPAARSARGEQPHQADPARHFRGQLFLRPGRQTEKEPRPHDEMAGETRRRHEIRHRLPRPVGLGRPPNPHRRRHHGRLANSRPGHR